MKLSQPVFRDNIAGYQLFEVMLWLNMQCTSYFRIDSAMVSLC